MSSFRLRNKRQYRGVKWIDTVFAVPYRRRLNLIFSISAGIVAQGISQIKQIQGSTDISKTEKKLAIAKAVAETHQAAIDSMNYHLQLGD